MSKIMAIYREQAIIGSSLNILVGIWLIFAPFILGYPANSLATWNDVILGILIGGVATARILLPSRENWPSWINVFLGFWLLSAPFVLGYVLSVEKLNDIISGIVVIMLSTWSAVSTRG